MTDVVGYLVPMSSSTACRCSSKIIFRVIQNTAFTLSSRNQNLRAAARSRDYRRVDIGASRTFSAKTDKFMRKPSARHIDFWTLQVELFNLLNLRNVDSYYWITDIYANQYAVPNYLTGFLFNFRVSVGFK